ncbi:hypothetical protein AURDEDRAFT_143005 [Auricularia subglabra TFB-10046 SS5]|nr:hypothetical protein AURDEDRAFT_143005 [Auricularia subglabra TFB-10046 SS5]
MQAQNEPAVVESALLPRTRKAKETQLRLGVGRPKLIGGTGARATNPKPVRASRRKTPAVEEAASSQETRVEAEDAAAVTLTGPPPGAREDQSEPRTAPLESIREDASGDAPAVGKGKGKANDAADMPAVPIVPIDVTPSLSSASSHASPLSVASSTTPNANDARVATLESRVGVLEAQNAMLLARVAALEEKETSRLASTTVGGPSSPAMSIPQSARIRSDASSLVPRSARVRSDASMQSAGAISRPQSVASARRVSGMPSPRRTSVAVQPSSSWLAGTTIAEEDEGNSSASGGIPVQMEVALAMQHQQSMPPIDFSQSGPASAVVQSVPLPSQPQSAQPSPPLATQHAVYAQQTMVQNQANVDMANMFAAVAAPAVAPHLHYPNLTNYAPSPPQQRPLWAASLPPHVVPSVAGPSTLGKHARDSAPSSPAVPSSESTPTTRPPPRKKPRLESSLGHGAPPHVRRMMMQQQQQQQPIPPQEVDLLPEPMVSINKSFAPKTPPRTEANAAPVPVPETPLTAAYGATLAALFRGPREEDIPEEERSPEKKTLYGTERSNDTRFGEFGWGWR